MIEPRRSVNYTSSRTPAQMSTSTIASTPSSPYYGAVFHDSFLFHSPLDSSIASPRSPLSYDSLVSPYGTEESGSSVLPSIRSPSPFSTALLTPSDTSEQFDAATAAASPYDESTSPTHSALLPYSPASDPSTGEASGGASNSSSEFLLPAPTARPLKRTRERIRGLTREQRAERKRTKHRQIDASRRQKEIAAMNSLRNIIRGQPSRTAHSGKGEEETEHDNRDGQAEESGEVTSKAVVLESSVELIRQLQALCAKMQAACNAKDKQIVRLASDLHSVTRPRPIDATASPDFTSSLLSATRHVSQLERSTCLRQSTCLSSVLCIAVLAVPLAVIIDCNNAFVDCAGWSREQLLQSVMKPPTVAKSAAELTAMADYRVCPMMVSGRRSRRQLKQLEADETADSTVERYVGQYPSSMQEIAALLEGTKQKIECTWRVRAADDEVYEVQMSAWCEFDHSFDPDTQQRVTACRMVSAHSMYDRVRVDEAGEENDTILG